MPLLLTKYLLSFHFSQGTGFSLFLNRKMGLRIKILTPRLQSFANILFSGFCTFWIFRKMSFGVIPYTTRVFFLIPWRFFPGSEFSWYKGHLTDVTPDVKITWKMEGWTYQWQKVAYSGAQEIGGFPWKQLFKNFLVLVLGFRKKTYLVGNGLVLWPFTL